MTRPRDWERVKAIFADALELPEEERSALVAQACGGDEALRAEVLSLLDAAARPGPVERVAEVWARPLLRELEAGLQAGSQIGGYILLRELGRGGMGVVYEAHDPRLQREIAIKLLDPRPPTEPAPAIRLLAEARAASALDHPNICTIYHVGEDEAGRAFVAMPLYRGETLLHRLTRGALPVAESVEIALQIARGLESAHAAGIVHRDVKPANLVTTSTGTVKILDFGIATVRGRHPTQVVERAGTAAYIAPEQLRGEEVDGRADLWALGVVLYEMLTGRRPFTGNDARAVFEEILQRQPEPLSTFRSEAPARLARVVTRLLTKNPADRLPSAAALILELEAVQEELAWGAGRRGALPVPLTEITGRDAELAQLAALLGRKRLLTVTGPGGAGKTRLAIEAGRRVADRFDDCRFVELAHLAGAERVAPTIAHTLGLLDLAGLSPLQRLTVELRERSLLLVLDNFEHLAAAADVVRELLRACPRLAVLVTSRTPLHIEGEQEFPLSPLRVPDGSAPREPAALQRFAAVRLFVERAQAVRPDFRLAASNAVAVAELCRRLDGLPLAIELAAARTRLFPPEVLLRRLAEHLDVLQEERGDRPDRHRRLSQAIAWSDQLLDAEAKRVFRCLSVFRGGFTLEAAAAICGVEGSGTEAVEALLDHSLVQRRDEGPEPRFTLLETIRSFAGERLAESEDADAASRSHAHFMAGLAESLEPSLTGAQQADALERLEMEHDNVRAALAWAERRDPLLALRLAAALWRFWVARGHLQEARSCLDRLMSQRVPGVPDALRARVLIGAGTIAHGQGDNLHALGCLEEALALCRRTADRRGVAATLNNLSWVACETTQLDHATDLAEAALRLCREIGDRRGEALALNNLGWVAQYRDDGPEARRRHAASLAIRREIGDRRGAAFALSNLAWAECLCGNPLTALSLLEEAEQLLVVIRDPILLGWVLAIRGIAERDRGEDARAVESFERALDRWRDGGNRSGRAVILTELAEIRLRTGLTDQGARLLREALEDWQAVGCPWGERRAAALLERAPLTHKPTR